MNDKNKFLLAMKVIMISLIFMALMPIASAGNFSTGKFNMTVSLNWSATNAEFNQVNNTIQQFSQQLYDSTDGIHQLDTVIVYNNKGYWDTADARLRNVSSWTSSSAHVLGIESSPKHMYMDTLDTQYVWVHEFGHYGYGNRDEYETAGHDPAECTDDGSGNASIMDGSRGYIGFDEFCTPCNHDADRDTEHEADRNMSTWQWMAYGNLGLSWAPNGYVDLRAKWPWNCSDPVDAHADPGPTIGYDTVNVIFKNVSEPNIVLLIDRSGSMSGQKITDAKNSAKLFVDLMQVSDMTGVVSYSDSPTVNYQLAEIVSEATKTTIKNAIDGISSGGMTAMGDGLRTSYNQLITYGKNDSPKAIVLLSNGWHNSGTEHPYDVIPDIQAENIRVYTVALGSGADETLMRSIADRTGGKYYFAVSSSELQEIYNDISAAITGAQSAGSPEGEISQGEVVEEEVTIDSSIKQVTFILNWQEGDLNLTLRKPDDSIIDPTVAAGDPNIVFISGDTYKIYRIDNPDNGTWTMIIEGASVSGIETYAARITAISDISFYLTMPEEINYPEPVLISAVLQEDEPIIDANVYALIIKNDESFVIELYDDGDEAHGDDVDDDGVYSNIIKPEDQRYLEIFSENGTYIVQIIAESNGTARTGGGANEFGPINYVTIEEPFVREITTRIEVTGIPEVEPITVEKDFRHTIVNFTHEPAILGEPLPYNQSSGAYIAIYVTKKDGTVSSTNPGQLYSVINITGLGVTNVSINDTFDDQFDMNPGKLGGGIEVIRVNATGYAEVLTDTPQVTSANVDNSNNEVTLVINLTSPLEVDEHLMIYLKFKTALKGEMPITDIDGKNMDFVNNAEVTIENRASLIAEATIEFESK